MPSEQFEHIQRIRNDFYQASERVRDSLNNSVRILAKDLYNKHTHFIFELIQNAEDNSYCGDLPSLSFQLTKSDPTGTEGADGALIIQNNETGFTDRNVSAICEVGATTKQKAQGYIGEKGIGFKSVFRVTENPHIFSNGYHFCLPECDEETGLGYIVPQWVDTPPEDLNFSQTNIILPLTKVGFGYDKIEEMLLEIEPETILFLSKLQEIRIQTDTGTDLVILKNADELPKMEVLVEGRRQGCSFSTVDEFLVCTQTFHKPVEIHHEKREGINERDVSIAFPMDENATGSGKIFAYLPVSETDFPFLINADFILTSSREGLQQDEPWNRWLMNSVAEVVASELLSLLKTEQRLTVSFLETLARSLRDFAEDKRGLFYPISSEVRETLMTQEFLPANDGTFVSAENAMLADNVGLPGLLNPEQLSLLFQQQNTMKWLSPEITARRTQNLWGFLRYQLEVTEVTPDMFARRLDETFLEQQTDDWFTEFYKFLSVGQAPPRSLWVRSQWMRTPPILRGKPILRLQDGSHVKPFGESESPNASLAIGTETDASLPIVKLELSQDEDVRRFLQELGIPEWDIVEEVIETVLPKYQNDSPVVSWDEHARDFEKIERAYNTGPDSKKKRLLDELRATPFILVENQETDVPVYRKPADLYLPNDELRLYFEGNPSYGFVKLEEYPESAQTLFRTLGVEDAVRIKRRRQNHQGYVIISDYYGRHQRGLHGFDPAVQIDGLKHAINNPTLEKSAFIWNKIAIPNADCIKGTVESATRQDYSNRSSEERESDSFGRLLIEAAWLPDADGNLRKPSELTLNQLPDSFTRDKRLADLLGMQNDLSDIPSLILRLVREGKISREKLRDLLFPPEPQPDPTLTQPSFPEIPVKNLERRANEVRAALDEAPDREYEDRLRSVRISIDRTSAKTYLKESYTNAADQLVCQICHEEMPFRNRNGEYYFDAVEVMKDYFTKEYRAQFLALCPKCSPQYKEFIKRVPEAMEELKNSLMVPNSSDFSVLLKLGDSERMLRFVERHWLDLQAVLAYYENADDAPEDSTD